MNPETGQMHGGYPTTTLAAPQSHSLTHPHSVMNPETGLMHGG
jgi:hypothetical protein